MSAKEKQVVEVQEKLEDITECPICTETYQDPKILPCIHTFCMICLQETGLKRNKSPGDKMPCPVCRTEFTVPEKGFIGLQRNFFMERLIEMKNILIPSSTLVLCDACQGDNDFDAEAEIPSAEMYCADCNQRLCGECCRHHRKYKATKNHRMLSLDGAQINIPSIVKPYVCDKHENKQLEIYCSSCQEAICALCLYKSHKTHDTSPIMEVVTDFRKIIQENSDSMIGFILDLKHRITEEDNEKAVFAGKVADVESEIKRIRQNLQDCTEKDCDYLLQQLNSIKQERIKENESQLCDIEAVLASLESYQVYCTQVTTIGSDVDICRAVQNLNTRAAELKQRYESVSLTPFPNMWLKKTECHDALYRTGNNIIGKIEEIDDNETLNAENKGSVIDTISSFMDELNDVLDKTSGEATRDVCQSKQSEEILDHSGVCKAETDDENKNKGEEEQMNEADGIEKERFVETLESIAIDDRKEWTTFIDKLSDKLQEIKVKINVLVERNGQLTSEMDNQRQLVSMLGEENHDLICKTESMKLTQMKSDEENVDLRNQVALLTSIVYDGNTTSKGKNTLQRTRGLGFLQKISAVDVPVRDEDKYRVTGLAIIDNELFVATTSNVVEVNDLRTLKFKRQWRVKEMKTVGDMKASVRDKYLYLLCSCVDRRGHDEVHMLRFNVKGNVIRKWQLEYVYINYAQISVTDESNVLLTDGYGSKLIEYSPHGKLIRTISLKWESGMKNVTHAIKLTSDHFLVCHGKGDDSLHRVCMVNIDGSVLKYFGEVGKSDKLNNPVYLEMAADGKILVADNLNQRLLLLSSSLEFMQALSPHKSKYPFGQGTNESRPQKLILDEANGRLFVAESVWKVNPQSDYKQSGDQLSAFTFSMK